jgi:hypothetical protein
MKPYLSLGKYMPTKWRASVVGRELTDLTAKLGLEPHYDPAHGPLELKGRNWVSKVLHAEVRRRTFSTKQAEGWHYDGDLEPNSKPDCAIITWASNTPTQIKWRNNPDKEFDLVFQAKPYEIVVFRNLECLHRRPPNAPRVRWLFRQRVSLASLESWLKLQKK